MAWGNTIAVKRNTPVYFLQVVYNNNSPYVKKMPITSSFVSLQVLRNMQEALVLVVVQSFHCLVKRKYPNIS